MCTDAFYNETQLLDHIAKGDHFAFRVLFDRYSNQVFCIAYKLLKSEALAEDAVQDVFMKLWVGKATSAEIRDCSAYINAITRNHVLNQLKRFSYAEQFAVHQNKYSNAVNHSVTPLIELNELNGTIAQAVSRLTPQQKRVYHLGKMEGQSYEQIAGRLQISKETVKTHMSEALRSVKTYLLQHGYIISGIIIAAALGKLIFF
jgi:RNA polymerase sigma-70 factor (ECF subfamily)